MTTNVVLIGMMGSGKSSVGRRVAERTGMEFIDLDEVIEDHSGRTIPELFDEGGEELFRRCETEALREVMSATHAVIATGGGIVTRAENRRLLKDLGKVFWLDAPASELLERIGEDENRPMLRGGDALKRIEALVAERREQYADASDYHLDTTEGTEEEMAERIVAAIGAVEPAEDDDFSTIVSIDGPVGSGKSALARLLARRLGFVHVDTGAMYRCVTLQAMRRGVSLHDAAALTAIAHAVDIRFVNHEDLEDEKPLVGEKRVLLNGEDVTEAIRAPDVSRNTSPVADVPTVRAEMVRLQRQLALHGNSVLEGRDISTVVVPEARWQIYLVASLEERVNRRLEQYRATGVEISPEQLRHDIIQRDERDRNRQQGALKLSPDATILDTTGIPLEEVVELVAALVESRQPAAAPRP